MAHRLFANRIRAVRLNSRYNPALQAIPALGQVGVLALGGWLAVQGNITLGTFLAFSTYLAQLVGPVRMLSGLLTIGQQARASVIRVFEVIDSRPVVTEAPDAVPVPGSSASSAGAASAAGGSDIPGGSGAPGIEFDDVTFGYVASRPVLNGLTLTARPGETLAVVGTSGSGKSTLSMLLPRFYDVQHGTVRVAGQDVRELTVDSLRATIGLVMEDSFLFSEPVRDNIAYGRPDATDEQIVAAARAAEADQFINELADGYDTTVGEQGLTLSGGQRQRVALARALITDPRILILDDATSAVDARIEADIHATLRRVMAGRTTLLIAHRRSTLALADRIAVLDEGRLIDVGTEQELEQRCPLYRLLLSGPGDDAEGVDAGELPVAAEAETPTDVTAATAADVTAALWDPARAPESELRQGAGDGGVGVPRGRAGAVRGLGPMGGALASMPPTPDLLAKVDALPPADDTPEVDDDAARAGDLKFTLGRLIRPLLRPLLLGLLLVAADAVAMLVLPALIRTGVDSGVQRGVVGVIGLVSVIGLAVVLVDWVVQTGQIRVTGRTGERLLYTLRVKTFAHLQRLGLDYYEREMSGRIMTRMTTDVDAFSSFLQTGLTQAVVSILTFFGILGALLYLNVELGLVVCSVLPVMLVATLIFRARSSRAYTEAREKVSIVNADLQENVAGMRVTQAYRRVGHNRERFSSRSDDYRVTRTRAQRYIATYFPFVQFLSSVAAALALVVGGHLVQAGSLTAGALIAYLLYIDMFFSPMQQLSQVFDGYQQAAVGLRRIRDLLRTPTSTPQAAEPAAVPDRLAGEIVFDRRAVRLQPGHRTRPDRRGPDRTTRRDHRRRRRDRRRQVHPRQARLPVLRRDRRVRPGRRRRRTRLRSARLPAPDGRRTAGGVPVPRHRPGHHRVRPPRREQCRGRGRRPGSRRARHDRPPRRRLLPPDLRTRPEPVQRPTATPRPGPRPTRRTRHPAHGRSDRGPRPGHRSRRHPRHRTPRRPTYHPRRRPPPHHRRPRRPHRRPRPRPRRRNWHPPRTSRRQRPLRQAMAGLPAVNGLNMASLASLDSAGAGSTGAWIGL